jgi:hypothetical protein
MSAGAPIDDSQPSSLIVCALEGDVMMIGDVCVTIEHRTKNRLSLRITAPLEKPIVLVRDGKVKIGDHHKLPAIARGKNPAISQ